MKRWALIFALAIGCAVPDSHDMSAPARKGAIIVPTGHDATGTTYTPSLSGNWSAPVPSQVSAALDKLAARGANGSVAYWTYGTSFSAIMASLPTTTSGEAGFIIADSSGGSLVMDSAANLDNIEIVGVHGTGGDAITIASGAALLGTKLRARNINFTVNATLYAGSANLDFGLDHSFVFVPSTASFAIMSGSGHVAITATNDSDFSVGGSKPVIQLGNSNTATIIATGQSTIGALTVGLATGASAAAATLYYDATDQIVSGWNGSGITPTSNPQGSATALPYTPAISGNWSPTPALASDAFDQLAARAVLGALGPGAGTYCGGSSYVKSLIVNSQGRLSGSVTCGTPSTSEVELSPALLGASSVSGGNVATACGGAGANTGGTFFYTTASATDTGVRFFWRPATTNTVRASLWDVAATTRLAYVDVSVTGTGLYTGTFGSSQALTAGKEYAVSFWETSGTNYSCMTNVQGYPGSSGGFFGGPHLVWAAWNGYTTTDAYPSSPASSERYPVEPVFTSP